MSVTLTPTPAYLAIARTLSVRVPLSQAPPKLLILDLNGTLLIRPKPRNVRNRPIHPRPYMASFRSFLFHNAVKPFIEVMIWSSAQPHSVNDMVVRCFEDRKNELKAIWARDTLGLDKADYFRKVQTVKNLEKRWSVMSGNMPHHTAETTLLVDDSALKAHLQPYNHLCVPEYTKNLRNRDLATKKALSQNEALLDPEQIHDGFDPTLIAIMGILDELKGQTNVAGWIRGGGLWAGETPPSPSPSFDVFSKDEHIDPSENEHSLSDAHRRMVMDPRSDELTSSDRPNNDAVLHRANDVIWFDHEPCFRHWVDRGIRAAKSLKIKLEHGLG
ncbi:hypothetical protein K439DRAFT_1634767 [Ramaria rubella]|nr:hypothetical protein K439DRAFT_1634767 [Ramaria rubella]